MGTINLYAILVIGEGKWSRHGLIDFALSKVLVKASIYRSKESEMPFPFQGPSHHVWCVLEIRTPSLPTDL